MFRRKTRRQWAWLKQEEWRLPELGRNTFCRDKYQSLEVQRGAEVEMGQEESALRTAHARGVPDPMSALWTTPNRVVLPEARARTHPKVTQTGGEGGWGEKAPRALSGRAWGSGLGCTLTSDLLLRERFTSCVPPFIFQLEILIVPPHKLLDG